MPNEGTEPRSKGKSVIARFLIPLGWTLWSILLLILLYGLVQVSTERTSSPEAGRGLGVYMVLFLMALLAGAGWLLSVAARKQSPTGLILMTLLLLYPLVMLVAIPTVRWYKDRRFANEEARVGDFLHPTLKPIARAIRENDTATLARLLSAKPALDGADRAGNDLLAYALVVVRDRKGSAEPVRMLLEAGADPRASRVGGGDDVVNFMVNGGTPAAHEAMRLLLEHGADPNAPSGEGGRTPIARVYKEPEIVRLLVEHGADIDRIQPDGVPAVVKFIGASEWESALYLIEKGANLDAKNAEGLSVDYYLNDWKENVYGQHPPGWDKVREAIAKRRALNK